MLTDVIEKLMDICSHAYKFNPRCCYSTPSFTCKTGLNYSGEELNCMTDGQIRFLLENKIRGGPASLMGNVYVKLSNARKSQHYNIEILIIYIEKVLNKI